jgi:hypothetical protein
MITCAMAVLLAALGILLVQGWVRMEARRRRARDEWGGPQRAITRSPKT